MIEVLFFMFSHCQLERPGYKDTKRNSTVYSSHLIKLVWKVNCENKKDTGCQRDWPNTSTFIILLRIEKITISSISGLHVLCPISQVQEFTICVVQGQHNLRKSVAHQAEHFLHMRPTVSIPITDFGNVDPKSSEQWYFIGPGFPLPSLIMVLNCNAPAWEQEDCLHTALSPSCTRNLLALQFSKWQLPEA